MDNSIIMLYKGDARMSYYGFYSDDYRQGKRDAERRDRPDYDRDKHFGGEKDEAYFAGFNEVKRENERREEKRKEEERYQEQSQRIEMERQRQSAYEEEENNIQEQEIYYQCFVCKKDFYSEIYMREVRDGNTDVLYCAECYKEIFASEEELERLQIGL